MYLRADLAIEERALARTKPLDSKPGRYRPPDALLRFLDGLGTRRPRSSSSTRRSRVGNRRIALLARWRPRGSLAETPASPRLRLARPDPRSLPSFVLRDRDPKAVESAANRRKWVLAGRS
jgi:hypothetical protein